METYNIVNRIKGNTSNAISMTLQSTLTGNPIDITGAKIYLKFRRGSKTGSVAKYISTESEGGITLTNPSLGIFTIEEFTCDFDAGNYLYDVKIVFATGRIKTWVGGQMVVEQNVT